MTHQPKKTADHRRAISNALRSVSTATDVHELILDNFDRACKLAHESGHDDCARKVLAMTSSLTGHGEA